MEDFFSHECNENEMPVVTRQILDSFIKLSFFQIGPFSKFSMKFIIKYEYINITYPAYLTFFVIF